MTEQTTEEVTTEEEVTEEVQPVLIDDILDSVIDDIDQPKQKVKDTPEEEPKEEPEKHKIKVDGEELEVSYDELVKGYQTNKHNTQTAQQLAQEQRDLSPIQGLAKKMEEDPEFAKHVFEYGKQPEVELDPIEQIKADAVKAAEAKVDQKFNTQAEATKQAEINALKANVQSDPHYEKVQTALSQYVKSMPEAIQKTMYETLDRDPQAYAQMYQKIRANIVDKPEPEKKVKPPALVDTGKSDEVPAETLRQQKLDKKRAQILKSGDHQALEDYFTMDGGLVDSLGL